MKKNKTPKLKIDWPETKKIRSKMASSQFIKITVNVDASSLAALKEESEKTGVPYQRLLNSLLKEGLAAKRHTDSRLDKIEKDLAEMKRRIAA